MPPKETWKLGGYSMSVAHSDYGVVERVLTHEGNNNNKNNMVDRQHEALGARSHAKIDGLGTGYKLPTNIKVVPVLSEGGF